VIATILIPLDGSELARAALPYGVALAKAAGARLVLFRAVSVLPMPGLDNWAAQKKAEAEAERELEAEAARLREDGLAADARVGGGDAAWAIRHAVQDVAADLVVMSTHGRGGIGRWFYGSVAEQTLRLSPVPVVLVPPACAWARAPRGGRMRVLVPLDGSELAESALRPAHRIATTLGAELVLVRVVEPRPADSVTLTGDWPVPAETTPVWPVPAETTAVEERLAAARDYLEESAARVGVADLVALRVVEQGDPAHQILETARSVAAALIVMATHGRTGLTRLVMGSVASAVVQRAVTPVVLVPPGGVALGEAPARAATTAAVEREPQPIAQVSLGESERQMLLDGLERLLVSTDRGTPEAGAIRALAERLQAAGHPAPPATAR
jgi:nucleotide-binding universal stress UspA family protein